MTTVADIYSAINELIPFDTKESWDNCGMLAGDPDKGVTKIITALDITNDVIKEAKASGAELIVSHHPVIFSPLKSVTASSPVGRLLSGGVSAICTHTPFDMSPLGMNKGLYDILSAPLGLSESSEPLDDMGNGLSIGRIYELKAPLTSEEVAERAKKALGCTCVRFTKGHIIKRIAVSSGAGNSFIHLAAQKGADALLSGDFKHDGFIDAVNMDFTVIDCGHFHTERIFCGLMKNILSKRFPEIDIIEAKSCVDPANYCL